MHMVKFGGHVINGHVIKGHVAYLTVPLIFMELHMKMSNTSTKNSVRKAGRKRQDEDVHSSDVPHGACASSGGGIHEQS